MHTEADIRYPKGIIALYLKPLYKDYKTQSANRLLKNAPIKSGGRLFEFADRAMVIAGEVMIIAALLVIRYFCPSKYNWIYEGTLYIALIASAWGFAHYTLERQGDLPHIYNFLDKNLTA